VEKGLPTDCVLLGKAALASGWFIFRWRFIQPRGREISFRQLRPAILALSIQKSGEADSKEVPADQIVKGFEYERGRYVVMKDEDFEKVRIESTHSIRYYRLRGRGAGRSKVFLQAIFPRNRKRVAKKAYAVCIRRSAGPARSDASRDQQPVSIWLP